MKTAQLLRLIVLVGMLVLGHSAFATPVRCSAGFQDNTCLTPIAATPKVAPTCPSSAGYTTATPAKWIGSGYTAPACTYTPPPTCSTAAGWLTVVGASWNGSSWSAPECSYTAPPVCPGGYNETSAPSWNGSSWVGLGCQPIAPVCPAGFTCDGNGTPYALMLGYCAEVSQTTILHVVHYTDSCTPSMAGAVRVNQAGTIENGNGTLNYWKTPSSFSTTSTQTYRNTPGPAGSLVQTVNIDLGQILYNPDDTGTDPTSQYEGAAGGGSAEGWVFACPSTHPTINFATVSAYGTTNPTLIQCQ